MISKASYKLFLLIVWLCLWYPLVWLVFKLKKLSWRDAMGKIFCRGMLGIIGIRLKVSGTLAKNRPLLLVSNHVSYIDIPILASCLPVCFTPKNDIAGWPIIGSLSRLSGAIFIDRRPEKMVEMKEALRSALAANRVVCLFPEATTGNGLHMQPFKSGFFSLADEEIDGRQLTIQPACITYTHIRGLPITSDQWPNVAWYSDMELAPHAWDLFKLGPIKAELTFLPPITMPSFGDRKKLAAHCHKVIAEQIRETRDSGRNAKPKKIGALHARFSRIRTQHLKK